MDKYIEMETTHGVDIRWHYDDNGEPVIEYSSLPPSQTAALMPHVCPQWVRDLIRKGK